MAANNAELTRADTKAAVLLGFSGAALGTFIPLARIGGSGSASHGWDARLLWWTAVLSALLAVVCFVCAIAPRRRKGRRQAMAGPGYFEHITQETGNGRLSRALERAGRDPVGPLFASLVGTSAIIRAKYRWIEAGTVLLLIMLAEIATNIRLL